MPLKASLHYVHRTIANCSCYALPKPLRDQIFPHYRMQCSYPNRGKDSLRAVLSCVQVGERGGGYQPSLSGASYPLASGRWRVKGKVAPCTQGTQGLSPCSHQVPLLSHYTGTSAPRSVTDSPRTPPFPDVLGAGLAFLLECFLLTRLSLPRGRKGSEARGPDPWGPPPSCFPCILLSSTDKQQRIEEVKGLGLRAGSLGPESQHPDCNNGSFKHKEKRQMQTEAQGEQNRVRGE